MRESHRDNLAVIRGAAAELPSVELSDALRICLVLRDAEPESYERAVVRWLGRFCLEQPNITIAQLRAALAAFERLPFDPEASSQNSPDCAAPRSGGASPP